MMHPMFLVWELDPDISGLAAALAAGGRCLDLTVTRSVDGRGVEWEVVDGDASIALGYTTSILAAQRAAERAARRELIHAVTR